MTTADVNGDGRLDIVIGDNNGASVLMGNGDGTFAPAASYAAGDALLGDDRRCERGRQARHRHRNLGDTVFVLLNDGTGGFSPVTSYAVGVPGAQSSGVTTADVNGDGKVDIVASVFSPGSVSVLLNDGTGGFGPATGYATTQDPVSGATTADVNGDGRADIITANGSGSVSVLLNNGTGGFGPASSYAAGSGPFSVVTADLNGDGAPDIVVADNQGDAISVLLGNGDGGFGPATSFASGGSHPVSVTTADVNGDSKPDLVVSNAFGGVSVLLNETNTPPTITSNGGGNTACVSVAENTTAVTTVTAQDQDARQTLTYSIDGGDDAAKFVIGAVTGKLAFLTSPDFEMPTDTKLDGFNTYHANVKVSDGAGGTDTQAIIVRVVDGNDDKPTEGKDHGDKGHSHRGHESKSSHGDDKPTGGKDHDDKGHSQGGHEGPDVFAFTAGKDIITDFKPKLGSVQLGRTAFANFRTELANTSNVGGNAGITHDPTGHGNGEMSDLRQSSLGDYSRP